MSKVQSNSALQSAAVPETRTGKPPSAPVALTIEEALDLGLKLHRAGRLTEAELLYRRILDARPDNPNALHFLGLLCHQQNRHGEAAGLIERIITLDPQNADAHNNLGNVLEGLGKIAEAERCYRKAIALRSDHAPAHNNLGVVLAAQKRLKEAVEVYRRAIELAPDSADFHYNLGNALRKSGEIKAAVEAYRDAVSVKSEHVGAWQGLTRTLVQAGRTAEAERAFEDWLQRDPANPTLGYLRAALLGRDQPDRAPDAYITSIFDEMADGYDAHLVQNLNYRAPNLLIEALSAIIPPPSAALVIVDAGCGTGLCGPLLRPYAKELIGVDLSAAMLDRAAGTNAYDNLVNAEITEYLTGQKEAFDVIVSADTLCYFGALEPVFRAADGALKPGGLLAFTLEDAGETSSGWQLNLHGRYAHPRTYVERALAGAGLSLRSISAVVLRTEGRNAVAGLLAVAAKINSILTSERTKIRR